jgi:hypothetical protein
MRRSRAALSDMASAVTRAQANEIPSNLRRYRAGPAATPPSPRVRTKQRLRRARSHRPYGMKKIAESPRRLDRPRQPLSYARMLRPAAKPRAPMSPMTKTFREVSVSQIEIERTWGERTSCAVMTGTIILEQRGCAEHVTCISFKRICEVAISG